MTGSTILPGVTEVPAPAAVVVLSAEPSVVLPKSAVVFALSSAASAVSVVEEPARLSAGLVVMAEEVAGTVAAAVLPEAVGAPQAWMFPALPGAFSKLNSPWTLQQQG
jgi:hypothetical protein